MKAIHTRGYLPHIEGAQYQFITYRLADALPQTAFDRISQQLMSAAKRRLFIDEYLDQGLGRCALANPKIAQLVLQGWHYFHNTRYALIAYVIMPNHVHVLIRVYDGQTLSRIVHSWKSFTAKRAQAHLAAPLVPFWQQEYWDRYIRDETHYHQVIAYIHENPVKAGLVGDVTDWPWSSAFAGKMPALPAFYP